MRIYMFARVLVLVLVYIGRRGGFEGVRWGDGEKVRGDEGGGGLCAKHFLHIRRILVMTMAY